jgi:hypothetical protein
MPTPLPKSVQLNFVLEQTDSGLSRATVLGLPDCQVEAATDEQAIAQLQQVMIQRLAKARIVPLEIPLASALLPLKRENPWTEFIGLFEGDAEFAAIAAELRAERELDDVA